MSMVNWLLSATVLHSTCQIDGICLPSRLQRKADILLAVSPYNMVLPSSRNISPENVFQCYGRACRKTPKSSEPSVDGYDADDECGKSTVGTALRTSQSRRLPQSVPEAQVNRSGSQIFRPNEGPGPSRGALPFPPAFSLSASIHTGQPYKEQSSPLIAKSLPSCTIENLLSSKLPSGATDLIHETLPSSTSTLSAFDSTYDLSKAIQVFSEKSLVSGPLSRRLLEISLDSFHDAQTYARHGVLYQLFPPNGPLPFTSRIESISSETETLPETTTSSPVEPVEPSEVPASDTMTIPTIASTSTTSNIEALKQTQSRLRRPSLMSSAFVHTTSSQASLSKSIFASSVRGPLKLKRNNIKFIQPSGLNIIPKPAQAAGKGQENALPSKPLVSRLQRPKLVRRFYVGLEPLIGSQDASSRTPYTKTREL